MNYLIEAGADRSARTKGRDTALIYAIRGGRLRVVAALLNAAFIPECTDGFGESALDLARRL